MPREAQRQAVSVKRDSRRRIDESVGLRFPGALAAITRAVLRFRPNSPLRRAVIRRYVRLALEAANRRDFDAAFVLLDRDCESRFSRGLVELEFDPVYRGRDGRINAERQWNAGWDQLRYEPEEVIDVGDDRLVIVGRVRGIGRASGVAIDNDWAVIVTLRSGRVAREEVFMDRAEAFETLGLGPSVRMRHN